MTSSAPTAVAISSGLGCMSTAVIRAAPARLRTATASAPIGPDPITSAVLPATSPARDTACQATAAGSINAAVRRSRPCGQGPEHPGRQVHVPAERPVRMRVTGRAAQVGAARGEVGPVRRIPHRPPGPGGGRVDRHRGPRGRAGPVRRGPDHPAGNLMPEHQRRLQDRLPRRAVQPVMQVRAADPAVRDLHHGLIRGRGGQRHVIDPQVPRRVGDHRRARDRQHVCCRLSLVQAAVLAAIRPPPSFRRR